jgi:hypothetical protein
MRYYFNATTSSLELPTPGRTGTRTIGVGEGFYGSAYYEKFVQQGLLARIEFGMALHKIYVDADDVAPSEATTEIPPYRYKKNGSITCEGQLKFTMAYSIDAAPEDPMLVTYYFYTDFNNASKPTHILSRVGVISNDWQFPDWAQLPDDFHDLDPLGQRDALLARQ